jgi:serine/threonine-protein kinase
MDPRLGREIAIKVLPAETSADAEHLTRLEREARTVAGLNHPGIVTLFSVEDVGGCGSSPWARTRPSICEG